MPNLSISCHKKESLGNHLGELFDREGGTESLALTALADLINNWRKFPPMRRSLKLLPFAALLIFASYAKAVCGPGADTLPGGRINVGLSGSNFTVFGTAGFSDTTSPYTNDTFTGPSFVQGNIGIGPKGTFSWSDGTIDGDVYMDGSSGFTMSGPAHFTNGHAVKYNQHAVLSPAFTDYQNLSDAADNECDTPPGGYTVNGSPMALTNVNITNSSQSMMVNDPFGGSKIVLHLNNFIMSAGTFTLEGTATTTYIINVKNQFSLNNAKILLADQSGMVGSASGVQASNVLFNIRSSGIQISLNQGTQMSGILLALHDKVSLSGGKVFGRVIGEQVNITSGGQVISQ